MFSFKLKLVSIYFAWITLLLFLPIVHGAPLINGHRSSLEDLFIILGLTFVYLKTIRKRRKPKIWVNPYLQQRREKSRYYRDFADMRASPSVFKENFHVSPEQFDELMGILKNDLEPKLKSRKSDHITAEEKLCVTLEFLASGSLQRHIASVYRISKQRIGPIIESTCQLIYDRLKPSTMPDLTKKKWLRVSARFNSKWNYPNCLGAIDGKHIAIKCPDNANSLFYNYKGYHSIVLMAVADADYKFLVLDVGAYGSEGDSSIFGKSDFGKSLFNGSLDLPANLPVNGENLPHVFLGDDAFPLSSHLMKPFKPKTKGTNLPKEESIFNYRLSRARRCVENTFGILCARWICLARTLFLNPRKAKKVVAACCVLQNWLMKDEQGYCPPGFADSENVDGTVTPGKWRKLVPENSMFHTHIPTQATGRPTKQATTVRNSFKNYFNSNQGNLSWQDEKIFWARTTN